MAVLGVQIVFTMIMASVMSKLSAHFSFGRWLLCGGKLARYVHPSDEELRRLAGSSSTNAVSRGKNSKRHERRGASTLAANGEDALTLSKSVDIQLDAVPVRPVDLLPLQFYTDYQWLMDFAICGMLIYGCTEAYYAVARPPASEVNLSVLWCLLIAAFALKTLFSVSAIYFRTEDAGERILCIVFGLFFLVAAMAVLIVPENTLDFGFESAHAAFASSASELLIAHGLESAGPVSLMSVRIVLALVSAMLGALLTFPGLRLARMHTDAMRYATEQPLKRVLLLINMIMPLITLLAWVRPLARDMFARRSITGETFELGRLSLLFLTCIIRLSLLRPHLQAHLNLACERVAALRREPGRIGSTELKKLIVRVYYYLCVVALQYLAPIVLLLFSTFLLKTLGDISVLRVFGYGSTVIAPSASLNRTDSDKVLDTEAEESDVFSSAMQLSHTLLAMRQVFTPACFKCLLSYFCWWICASWFTTSAFGLIYYTYFVI